MRKVIRIVSALVVMMGASVAMSEPAAAGSDPWCGICWDYCPSEVAVGTICGGAGCVATEPFCTYSQQCHPGYILLTCSGNIE